MMAEYSLLAREVEDELLPACQAFGIGVIPYFPLAAGVLTGKYREGEPAPPGTRGHQSDRCHQTRAGAAPRSRKSRPWRREGNPRSGRLRLRPGPGDQSCLLRRVTARTDTISKSRFAASSAVMFPWS